METGFLNRGPEDNRFVVYVPRGVKDPLPAILFLHGRGESGTDGLLQTEVGLGTALRRKVEEWPFAVVMPQKPVADQLWPNFIDRINACLTAVESEFELDPHRRYLTGLSQGGHGTWMLVNKLAWTFAAAAPVCGWTEGEEFAESFRHIPVRAFHGDADQAVPVAGSERAVAAVRALGGTAELKIYPGVGHNSWDAAYQTEGLAAWFLTHQL